MDIRIAIGLRIKELRDERGLTQSGFSDISGLDRSYLAALENGTINLGVKTLEKIAIGFGLTVGEFMQGL